MSAPQMVMFEEEFREIQSISDNLVRQSRSRVVCIIDKAGQLIASSGETEPLDTTSLASLTAGNVAATGGMANLLRENEFATIFLEGDGSHIYSQIVGNVILVVIFDSRTNVGMVRLRVRKAVDGIQAVFEALEAKSKDPNRQAPFNEITDDDIDNLFND